MPWGGGGKGGNGLDFDRLLVPVSHASQTTTLVYPEIINQTHDSSCGQTSADGFSETGEHWTRMQRAEGVDLRGAPPRP